MTSTYKTASQFNRAAGALAGQFVGDAFGAQYEFSAPMGHVSDKIMDSPAFGTAPGQITDDGELAIELILSMLSRSGKPKVYQTSDAEANYKRWYKSKPFDMGEQHPWRYAKIPLSRTRKARQTVRLCVSAL